MVVTRYLKFNNTLSQACKNRLNDLSFEGWSFHHGVNTDQTYSLYFLSESERTMEPGEENRLVFLLEGMAAEAAGGARGTRVEMRYSELRYAGDETPLAGHRMIQVDVVNMRGREAIPLNASFAGSNAILNDGFSENSLEMRVTNLMADSDLALTKVSAFILYFEVEGSGQDRPWALAKADEVTNMEVALIEPNSGWSVIRDEQATQPSWEITPQADTSLAPGAALVLDLRKLISSLATGQANLYLRYQNIPGYRDGLFVCTIEKSPLITRDQKVAIGRVDPQAELHVDGQLLVDGEIEDQTGFVMPAGGIIMWSGSTSSVPKGWVLCDGRQYTDRGGVTRSTPNLRDRFIVGAGGGYSVGSTGGLSQVSLTESQMPRHNHTGYTNTDGSHSHSYVKNGSYHDRFRSTWAGGDHQSTLSLGNTKGQANYMYVGNEGSNHRHYISTGNKGSGSSHENRPPYYALCFILKK